MWGLGPFCGCGTAVHAAQKLGRRWHRHHAPRRFAQRKSFRNFTQENNAGSDKLKMGSSKNRSRIGKLLLLCVTSACQSVGCYTPQRGSPSLPSEGDFHVVDLIADRTGHEATAFSTVIGGRIYYITARHVLSNVADDDTIDILENDKWCRWPIRVIGRGKAKVDIAVFTPSSATSYPALPFSTTPLADTTDGFDLLGRDAWLLGFPLALEATKLEHTFPILEHAYIADWRKVPLLYWFDGNATNGCSGGPIFACNQNGERRILAVVSSGLDLPGHHAPAGLFMGYSAIYARMIIKENPTGMPIKPN